MPLPLPKKILHFCAIILCILGAIYSAQWFWSETPTTPTKTEIIQTNSTQPIAKPTQALNTDIRDILSADLFKQQKQQIKTAPIVQANIPKTKLPLFLYGIISSSQAEDSIALITNNKKNPALPYKQGDSLPKQGGTVHLILESEVHIKHNGRLEKLELIKEKNSTPLKKEAFKYSNRSNNMSLAEIKGSYRANAPRLLKQMGLQKTAQGIQLSTQKGKLPPGLNPGDVITSVSGYTLADLEADPSLLDELLQNDKLEASLLRNGRTIHFTIPQHLIRQWK